MAQDRGLYSVASAAISTNTDTSIIAAPGVGKRIYIIHLAVGVSTAGTSSLIRLEDGAGGDVIAAAGTAALGTALERTFATGIRHYPGFALSENTALNAETSGSGAATLNVTVIYEVK